MAARFAFVCLLAAAAHAFAPSAARGARPVAPPRSAPEEVDPDAPPAYQDPTTLSFRNTKYFFGRVTVGLGPGMKPMDEILNPGFKCDTSSLGVVELPLPMGMIFEESEVAQGKFEIVEVVPGSSAEAAGVRAGDLLRATTAMAVNWKASMEEADTGFIEADAFGGKPGLQRALFNADGQTFDSVLTALSSNAEDKDGPGVATLVIERRTAPDEKDASS